MIENMEWRIILVWRSRGCLTLNLMSFITVTMLPAKGLTKSDKVTLSWFLSATQLFFVLAADVKSRYNCRNTTQLWNWQVNHFPVITYYVEQGIRSICEELRLLGCDWSSLPCPLLIRGLSWSFSSTICSFMT